MLIIWIGSMCVLYKFMFLEIKMWYVSAFLCVRARARAHICVCVRAHVHVCVFYACVRGCVCVCVCV